MNRILNKNDYLVKCRGRNNRDIQRTLRTYIKWLYTREEIPLDDAMYPDFMIEDMRAMGRIASRLLTQLEMQISSGMNLRQLEFNFEVNQ